MKSEKSTLSVLFYLKRDKVKKNGLVPIHARITVDGQITQFNTKLEIGETAWKSGKVMGRSFDATRINSTLNEIRAGIHTHYHTLQQRDGYVTAERVKNAFLGKEEKEKTIIAFFEQHNEQFLLKVCNDLTTRKTYSRYELTKNRLINFMKEKYKVSDMPVHEAAIMVDDYETCKTVLPELQKVLPALDVRSWDEIQPALKLMFSWTDMINSIILVIFLLALSFGIVNTMLMAVLERTRELGMLACIGMSKRRIFNMIMLETLFLTCVGSIIGIIIGSLVIGFTAKSGIDLTFMLKDQFEDYGFGSIVYPVLNIKIYVEIVLLVLLAGIISAIYPAKKALSLNPLEAIRNN